MQINTPAAAALGVPVLTKRKLTPSAAGHTYSVAAYNSAAGTGHVYAGAGGSGNLVPGYIRITKA